MNISRGLPRVYTAVQMHLHWGGLDLETSGSEHTIDGMRYFAEVRAAQGLRGGGSGPLTLGNWELHPTEPAGSNAEPRGKPGLPQGWVVGAVEGLSLVVLAQKAPRKARARALVSFRAGAAPPESPQTC